MKSIRFIIGGFCFFLTICCHIYANDIYVGPQEAITTIQGGIDAAGTGDTVIVAQGTYLENINFNGKNIIVTSSDPENQSIVENTIINGGDAGSVVTFANGEGPEAKIAGFTIVGGFGTEDNSLGEGLVWGAGIYCVNSSPMITRNIIAFNHGPVDGQTLACYGGGICCRESEAVITGNLIKENAAYAGAGIMVYIGNVIITNNIIRGNSGAYGGGVCLLYGGPLTNNTILGNFANEGAGGNIYFASNEMSGESFVLNNIIAYAPMGGGIYAADEEAHDFVLYNNVYSNYNENYINFPQDLTGLNGNISQDPLFIDVYHIDAESPCYETGDPDYIPYSWQLDIDGEPPIMNMRIDIGADEVTGNARPTANAGQDQYFDTIPEIVILNGHDSFDPDEEDTLSFDWNQTAGPEVTLVDSETAEPSFIPTVESVYLFGLTVHDGELTSPSDYVMIVIGNREPVADAGQDIEGDPEEKIFLNGLGSYDPDVGDILSYSWTQTSGIEVELADANTPTPWFVPQFEDEYEFELIVSDGLDLSEPDYVNVSINIGSGHDAYGYQWIDSDNNWGPQYYWIDIQNTGTEVTGIAYSFEEYFGPFSLGFNFNFYGHTYSQFYVQSNGAIGFDPVALTYNNVQLPTEDEYNNMIAWMWTYMDPDNNSKVFYKHFGTYTVIQFVDYAVGWGGSANAEIIIYESGRIVIQYKNFSEDAYLYQYTIGIENYNGTIGTQASYNNHDFLHDELAVEFSLGPPYQPVSDAGPDQHVLEIQQINLDGGNSYDRDITDVLTYQWIQTGGAQVDLSDPTAAEPNFLPESEGEYKFELVVSDGVLMSFPDEVLIVVGNRPPVADAGEDIAFDIPGQVSLNGTNSYDLDPGAVLQYIWTQIEGPVVELHDPCSPTPYYDCTEHGLYKFQLVVSDGTAESEPSTVQIITVETNVNQQTLEVGFTSSDYFHYPDLSGNNLVYGVGSACDVTWNGRHENMETGTRINIASPLIQPKIDGDIVVWFKYGDGFGSPWYHEPSNCSVFARDLSTSSNITLRSWSWSDSYGHPVISGNKVIWMEHHNLDPNPIDSPEANYWWNTPFDICGADISNFSSPEYFTIKNNAGNHDPYPCQSYGEDFDDVIDIYQNIVVWEGNGDIFGADISDISNIKYFTICSNPARQYDPAISGNIVVWTDQRNDEGDLYGADISDLKNIRELEIINTAGIQQQAAIDNNMIVYVDGDLTGSIKACVLTKCYGGIDIELTGSPYGCGPVIDGKNIVWQTASYGELQGMSIVCSYSIFTGPIQNLNNGKYYDYIQHAINESSSGDEIVLNPGIYPENININGKNIILRSLDPDNPEIVNNTIINGDNAGTTVAFAGSEDNTCQIKGVVITGGSNCGVLGKGSSASIFNCEITKNTKQGAGGGIQGINGLIKNCKIIQNTSTIGGGLAGCHGIIVNCIISENIAANSGGGLNNCDGQIVNCTIAGNTAESEGVLRKCNGSITNCIIFGNDPESLHDCVEPTFSCFLGGSDNGNIDADPMFAFSNDYHLIEGSPCIDTGTDTDISEDIEGSERPQDGDGDSLPQIDMGAYERTISACIAVTPDTINLTSIQDPPYSDEQILSIRNCGSTLLNWEISCDSDWLQAEPSSGSSSGEIDEIKVRAVTNNSTKGLYSCYMRVIDTNASNSPRIIKVTFDNNILHVPKIYNTIQTAIDTAENGDMVIVDKGTHHENICFNGKNITLMSNYLQDPSAVNDTIIKACDAGSTVYLNGNESADCEILGLTITGGDYEPAINNLPEGYWKLDEADGDVTPDSSTNGLNGVLKNGACIIHFPKNVIIGTGALKLDGTNDYVEITDYKGVTGTSSRTCTAWIKSNIETAQEIIYWGDNSANGSKWLVMVNRNQVDTAWTLRVNVYGGYIECNNTELLDNQWHHIAVVLEDDGSPSLNEIRLYIDSVPQTTYSNASHAINTASGDNVIIGGLTRYFQGKIDDVRIYDTALCQEDISRIYKLSLGGAGINGYGSTATVKDCIIRNNAVGLSKCSGRIQNCLIVDNNSDSLNWTLHNCKGDIVNCTIVNNIRSDNGWLSYCEGLITNCIIWGYVSEENGNGINACSTPTYSCFHGAAGHGNIDADPLFVNPDNGDYHLMSAGWSWDAVRNRWTYDDMTSPCIDAGNPGCPLGDEVLCVPDDPDNLWGENIRINMGAYGSTSEASMAPIGWMRPADLTNDGIVDVYDVISQTENWLDSGQCQPGDLDRNGDVDITDFALLAEDWLTTAVWY